MGMQFRLPDIKGTEREQLRQLRSYLYGLIPQLQLALDGAQSAPSASSAENGAQGELGLSVAVSFPEKIFGNGGAGCRYRKREERVSVVFCCASPAQMPVRVSANPLPSDCRPHAPVLALCPAEFADGAGGVVCAQITADGYVDLLWAKSLSDETAPTAIDGKVEFLLE